MHDTLKPCTGGAFGRRTWLKLGIGGLAGGSFPGLLGLVQQARAADKAVHPARRSPANCILIWMDGGPTHIETFDPKPDAPAEMRGEFVPISTNVPGIQMCELLPRLARITDKLAIVRSIVGATGDHYSFQCMTGRSHSGSHRVAGRSLAR